MVYQELLAAYPEFGAIDSADWHGIMQRVQRMRIPSATVLMDKGVCCEHFLLLTDGTVRIYQPAEDGREITLYRISTGGLCMLSLNSLLHQRPFMAVAKAETDVTIQSLTHQDFQLAMQASDVFRNLVLKKVTDRFLDMIHLVEESVFHNLDMRLACLLGYLFERNQGPILNITHDSIARELGTSREVISRLLKEFERKGCIALSRGKICLTSPEGLRWFGKKSNKPV